MAELGKALLGLGLLLAFVGAILLVAAKIGLPLGRLPGRHLLQRQKRFGLFSIRDVNSHQRCTDGDFLSRVAVSPMIDRSEIEKN